MTVFPHNTCFVVLWIGAWIGGCAGPSQQEAELLFVHEVQPLLKEKCYACHGDNPDEIEGAFDIRSLEGMLAGGESGQPALAPGHADRSPIYTAVTWEDEDLEMPPKENDRLTPRQIETLRSWIEGGAPWPDAERQRELGGTAWDYAGSITVATSGGLSEAWTRRRYRPEDLWAFYPVQRPTVPYETLDDGIEGHPVDAFIERKLEQRGLEPAGRADRLTLIRRATFDLTGLPPRPDEVEAFLQDTSRYAFQRVVDRLLDSPHYGEQWGRHWLDVVRYADTNGFSNDYERPNAWRYRDYVIRSFNEDKPYDRFILEQIAGDELDPADPEMLIATGFLRMGPWEHTAMSVAAETRQFYLDDVTNSVGETFLSNPLRCARCHDHKFDPIPTRDYYRVQAVFASVQFADREAPYLPEERVEGFDDGRSRIQNLIKDAEAEQAALREKEESAARAWMEARGLTYLPRRERRKLPDDRQPPRYYGLTYQDLGYRKVLNKRRQLLLRQLDRYKPLAFSVYNGPPVKNPNSGRTRPVPEQRAGDIPPTFVLTGGSVYAPSDSVAPGLLSAVRTLGRQVDSLATDAAPIPSAASGRRLAFASWLASEEHPITARSIVNRIWQYHFGQGLAATPNNFGVMGKKPTHPELLDWLARYFVDHGWSIKTMHRLIMASDAYQRASTHPERGRLSEIDPDNTLLAYYTPRRLTAEELRDAMLFVSGELHDAMGGLPVKPEINMEVALQPRHLMGSISPAYQPSRTPEQRNRRSIYTYRYRGLPDPMLEVFNRPSPDLSCERRTASTVTPQAFTLFNSQNTFDRALAMALRVERDASSLEARVERAAWLAWNRAPTDDERKAALDYLSEMRVYHREHPPTPRTYPAEVKRTMFEEMTGEPFEYVERLDVFASYVPDAKPWDVPPETRALADLCRVLFNTNEFIYVY